MGISKEGYKKLAMHKTKTYAGRVEKKWENGLEKNRKKLERYAGKLARKYPKDYTRKRKEPLRNV